MNKTVLKKIIKSDIFEYLSLPGGYIEIFSNVKFKDYYLRGQATIFLDPFYDTYATENRKLIAIGYYFFFLFVLVNNKYQKIYKKENYEFSYDFGIFVGNTIDEVLEKNPNNNICNYEDFSKNDKLMMLTRNILNGSEIIPISIKKEDFEIKESSYLKKSIEEKKDIILLDMDIILDNIENYEKRINIESIYPQKIYSFPALNYSDIWEYEINDRKGDSEFLYTGYDLDFIKNLYDIVCLKLDYHYLSRKDYSIILRNIGNLAWDWIDKEKITKKYLKHLNVVQSEIGDRNYPFTNFCYKFLDELIADLVTQKQISQCQFCGDYFRYLKGKKYCSLKFEGKDCGKKARDKIYYEKHKKEILPKARKTTKESREFYRKMGIEK